MLVNGPIASTASTPAAANCEASASGCSPGTTSASTSCRASSARHSVFPPVVLMPTTSTSGCASAVTNATASSGLSPTSVSIQRRTVLLFQHRAQRARAPGARELRLREREPALLELLGHDALTPEERVDELASVDELQRGQRGRNHGGSVHGVAELLRELGVRNGARRREVDGARDR